MFATGIECSYPTIAHGRTRRDLLAECGHYERYRDDLGLVKELGLNFLRYGLPYYNIQKSAGQYDWEFADLAMHEMRRLGIEPILDLMHFGVPDWLGNYQSPELLLHFAAYCAAVAARYPWVRFYTPVNEIYVTAKLSAKDGLWNAPDRPELRDGPQALRGGQHPRQPADCLGCWPPRSASTGIRSWYSLIDQVDWDIGLAAKNGTVNGCGLYDLDRQPRPVVEAYKLLLKEYGQLTIVPHGELFEIGKQPAMLKVEI